MYRYRYFDYTLVTDQPYPELVIGDDASPVMRLNEVPYDEVQGVGHADLSSSRTCHIWQDSGMFSRVVDGRYQLVFPDLLTVNCDPSGLSMTYCAAQNIEQVTLRHLLLDQALPRFFSLKGDLILHASAVSKGDATIAFVGASGLGKSTLAGAYFQQGWEILSDDCIKVMTAGGSATIGGSYCSLRLLSDAASSVLPQHELQAMAVDESDKYRFSVTAGSGNNTPSREDGIANGSGSNKALSMIVILTPATDDLAEPVLEPVGGAAALFSLLSESFSLDPANKTGVAARVEMISTLLEQTPLVVSLAYPRRYNCLPDVMALLQNAAIQNGKSVAASALQPKLTP